ncbi:MAG: 50S ribosomal protein L13 [Planctomycetota bacterium]
MHRFAIQRSFVQRKEDVVRQWFLVDAQHEILGRMATKIARILMGKNKPSYTPHVDCGDFVVVTNARKVQVTGKKREQKLYYYHTGFMGGLRSHNLDWMLEKKPEKVLQLAVRRMLPKTKLGRQMLTKLKVYPEAKHPHVAQNPREISLSGR